MEGGYKVFHIAVAIMIFAVFVGILGSVSRLERQSFQGLSEDVSESTLSINSVLNGNFGGVVTGSELRYALKYDKDYTFCINGTDVTESNCDTFYYNIKDTDVFNAKLNNNVWEFTLDTSKSFSIDNASPANVVIEDEPVINGSLPIMEVDLVEEMEVNSTHSFNDLSKMLQMAENDITLLFTGVFGNFSCSNKDLSQLADLLEILGVDNEVNIFKVSNSSLNDLQQVSFMIDTSFIGADMVVNNYIGKLVYGNNLEKVLMEIVDEFPCFIQEGSLTKRLDTTGVANLKRTAIYCVYKTEEGLCIKNSNLTLGIELECDAWIAWQEGCGNVWEYNRELYSGKFYRVISCDYSIMGSLTKINLEELGE